MMRPARQKWLLVLVAILFLTNIATLSIFWFKKPKRPGQPAENAKRKMGQWMVDQMKFDSVQAQAYWKMRDSVVVLQRPFLRPVEPAQRYRQHVAPAQRSCGGFAKAAGFCYLSPLQGSAIYPSPGPATKIRYGSERDRRPYDTF